jgi:hypothetical protein
MDVPVLLRIVTILLLIVTYCTLFFLFFLDMALGGRIMDAGFCFPRRPARRTAGVTPAGAASLQSKGVGSGTEQAMQDRTGLGRVVV